MKYLNKISLITFFTIINSILFLPNKVWAQDDELLKQLDNNQTEIKEEPILGTFNTTRLINVHTTETAGKNVLEFRIVHRFGTLGGGGHEFFGLDASSDIQIGFDYGITSRLMVGIGRSKVNERYDGFIKYKLLRQTETKIPLSITLFGNATIDASTKASFLVGNQTYENYPTAASRWNYCAQVILARKFNKRFSLMLAPTFLHRNYVGSYDSDYYILETPENKEQPLTPKVASNNIFALGGGAKFRVSRLLSITADAVIPFDNYLNNKPSTAVPYKIPVGLGVELEVGGHVFSINMTNAEAILPNQYLLSSPTSFSNWGQRLGFTIVRVFTPGKRIVKKNGGKNSENEGDINESKPRSKKRERERI